MCGSLGVQGPSGLGRKEYANLGLGSEPWDAEDISVLWACRCKLHCSVCVCGGGDGIEDAVILVCCHENARDV